MKARIVDLGISALALLLMVTIVSAQTTPYIVSGTVTFSETGIAGVFGVWGIGPNDRVAYSCTLYKYGVGSAAVGVTQLSTVGQGGGNYPFWCQMSSWLGSGLYQASLIVAVHYFSAGVTYTNALNIGPSWIS